MTGRVVVGTSSWADPGFVEEWYPPGLPARDRLAWYAGRFEGVEVNATFYAVPPRATVERWVEQTPDGFTFDVKLHRLLSRHAAGPGSLPKALRDHADVNARGRVVLTRELEEVLLGEVLEVMAPLAGAGRLSAFLLQLSPAFVPERHALDDLRPVLEHLAPHPVAIELRHRAWTSRGRLEDTLRWFEAHGAAWVGVDAPQVKAPTALPPLDAATHPRLVYLRAHGRNAEGFVRGRTVAERFAHRYTDDELHELRGRVQELATQVPEVRMMFNNNRGDDAPVAAARFRELLGQAAA